MAIPAASGGGNLPFICPPVRPCRRRRGSDGEVFLGWMVSRNLTPNAGGRCNKAGVSGPHGAEGDGGLVKERRTGELT